MSESAQNLRESFVCSLQEVHRFVKECLIAIETPEHHAEVLAKCLTEADYRGRSSDGLARLDAYVKEIREGSCDKNAVPEIIKETVATGLVDGKNGLGVIVGNFCMDLAIKKAKDTGVGWVVVKGSNRFGSASNYSMRALREGMIGMTFSNGSPLVAPTFSSTRALGTNPMAVSAPALLEDNYTLDMSTSAASAGMIELHSKTHLPIPNEWANIKTGALYPLGGQDPVQNHKGFGLGMLVEIFCGILSGSAYGPHIRRYGNYHQVANLGQCFIAVNPEFFEPGFQERLQDFVNILRNLEPATPQDRVIIPGDKEREHMDKVNQEGGVRYSKSILHMCSKYAKKLNVQPLQHLN